MSEDQKDDEMVDDVLKIGAEVENIENDQIDDDIDEDQQIEPKKVDSTEVDLITNEFINSLADLEPNVKKSLITSLTTFFNIMKNIKNDDYKGNRYEIMICDYL